MANDVFANTREISCKKADGKGLCCFPDVCMTPPTSPATPAGVPVPYPNTAFSRDTANGSRTVKISGKEIMLKNKSYFKTSTGDEAGCATPAKKGIITGKIKGKLYFTSWSMDVKAEGKNVVRHLDIATHNHASFPGNTPTWPYLDSMAFSDSTHPCNELANDVKDKCEKYIVRTRKRRRDSTLGEVKRKPSIEAMCADEECKKARACVLSPESPNNCCDGKTPHHLIPAHCFMKPGERGKTNESVYSGCEGYNSKKAPCICVEGASKTGEHGELHDYFDNVEDLYLKDNQAGSWSYMEARNAAVDTVDECTECDPECAGEQLDSYHQGGNPNISNNTPLRADSGGKKTPENFTPSESTPSDIL